MTHWIAKGFQREAGYTARDDARGAAQPLMMRVFRCVENIIDAAHGRNCALPDPRHPS